MFARHLIAPARRGACAAGFALLAALVLMSLGCDRTTKRGVAATMEETGASAGPRNAAGGVQFVYEAPEAQAVHLAGSFNNWSTSADPLTRDAKGRWTIVKPLPAGSHQYKFVINGGAQWKQDPANPKGADDGFGGQNSLLDVGADGKVVGAAAAPAAAAGGAKAASKPAASAGGPVKTDAGWRFTFDQPAAKSVHLAGSFNSWSTSADPLSKDANGRWTIVKELPAGSHQYKFVIDGGTQWKEDPANPNSTDDGYGGKNSLLDTSAPGTPARDAAAVAPAVVKPTLAAGGPVKTDAGYLFTCDVAGAKSVALAGSFNGWSTSSDPLAKNDKGQWTLVKALPPGPHQYKFVVDGGNQWLKDPMNPNTADDGFGGQNSVLVVP